MDCILKKEDFIFTKTPYSSFYECDIDGFKLNIELIVFFFSPFEILSDVKKTIRAIDTPIIETID